MASCLGVLASALLFASPPNTASAETNCPEVARNTQLDLVKLGEVRNPTTSAESVEILEEVFRKSLLEYPECFQELETVWEWNRTSGANSSFPFPKSDDPKSYPLGPVSWWWDTIYNGLFNGNTALMFLFGWELFLMPFPLVLGVVFLIVTTPLTIVRAVLARRNKK
jgi:hypothetical protein